MKFLLVKSRRLPLVFYLLLLFILLSVVSLNFAVTSVMAGQENVPIYRGENCIGTVAITMNIDGYINIDKLNEVTDGAKITLFLSEYYCQNYGNEVIKLSENGFCLGVLDRSMKGLSKNQINNIISYRVENLSYLTKKSIVLVRFENNLYDESCVKSVYDKNLFPIQWACDASAEDFTSGDIILVDSIEELKNTIKKAKYDGFKLMTVEKLLNTTSV